MRRKDELKMKRIEARPLKIPTGDFDLDQSEIIDLSLEYKIARASSDAGRWILLCALMISAAVLISKMIARVAHRAVCRAARAVSASAW